LPESIVVHEIYDTIQGESTLAGTPCTIVRLAGCPLRCHYCDTPAALPFSSGEERKVDDIVQEVCQRNRALVLVTGGEPLAQKQCRNLLGELVKIASIVQLETSGAFDIGDIDSGVRRILDIKTPGSGEEERNRWSNLDLLRDGDEIKFVIKDRADYEWAMSVIERHSLAAGGLPILFSPIWKLMDSKILAGWILEDRAPVRLQWQLHKLIWGGETQSV